MGTKLKRILFGDTWHGRLLRILTLFTVLTYPFGYHYRLVYIDGISMEPTYGDSQWSLEQRKRSLSKNWVPDRFDVITVWSEKYQCTLCKRVIGLPGETIEVRDGIIYINNNKLVDTFGKGKMVFLKKEDPTTGEVWWKDYDNIEPRVIGLGYVWVVGDNREDSIFGEFPINKIRGKVILY